MAEFTHFSAAATSPTLGWLTLLSSQANWSQVELNATTWTIRGTAQSGFAGWTLTVTSAGGFTAGTSAGPTGIVGGMDLRNPAGELVVTVRGLADLGVQARDMAVAPSLLFAGNDTFTGSAGDDIFWGGTGVDSISAGDGNDSIYAQSGVVDGGAGFDYFNGSGLPPSATETGVALSNFEVVSGPVVNVAQTTTGVTITGVTAADPASRSQVADFITGGSGADHITTDWAADTIRPGLGDDYIDAGNPFSAQVIIVSPTRPNIITYTIDPAKDTLDLSQSPRGVTVDLTKTTAQDTGIGVKTLLGFEIMRGSAFNDTLSGASFIGGGESTTTSPVGAITIYGGAGDDRITGGPNADLLAGEDGNDTLNGGSNGSNTLDGGAGFDIVDYTGNGAAVSITLGASTQANGDVFISIEGVIGSAFADTLSSSTAAGVSGFLAGGAGDDMIYASQYGDILQGGAGNDTVVGGSGADKFVLQLDGSVDMLYGVQGAQGDTLLLLDSQGAIASGANGLLILDTATGRLSWDADSDAGPIAPVVIAQLEDRSVNFEFRSIFAAGFQPSAVRLLSSDGNSAVVYDWGAAAFEHTFTIYRPDGALARFDIYFDDGGKSNKFWDFNNTETWTTRVADYDAQGRMTAYSVQNDDGTSQVFQYDLANTRPWDRLVEISDALGRLRVQGIKNDDGTASERYIDTYDTEPWAYYIDNYDALGRLLNHTFYNANGTVFG